MTTRFNSLDEIRAITDRALAKIDQSGKRGATLVTVEELDALACEIVLLRAELARFHSERSYIIGVNDGFDAANHQSNEVAL